MIKAGLILMAIAVALVLFAWASCLFTPTLDGQRFYTLAYRMGLVLPLASLLALASALVFVIDYIARIKGGPRP